MEKPRLNKINQHFDSRTTTQIKLIKSNRIVDQANNDNYQAVPSTHHIHRPIEIQ